MSAPTRAGNEEVDRLIIYRSLSPGLRFWHWVWAICIPVLFVTGLYIGDPMFIGTQGKEPTVAVAALFSMETIRFIHFTAGFILTACLLARAYLFFTYPGNRQFPNFFSKQYWLGLVEMMTYYGFLRRHHRLYLRNPLAASSYAAIYMLMVVEAVTGLGMYVMIRPDSFLGQLLAPVNGWLGNEYVVHLVHHIIAWIFVIFSLGHIYMVFYNDIVEKSGELSSIVSGEKHFKEKPVDADDTLVRQD